MAVHFHTRGPHLRGGRLKLMSEINVTPMVDVMLVLLVIFMITAPLLTVGLQVNLPESEAPTLPGQDEPLTVTVDAEGQIFIQETGVELEDLVPRLVAITENKRDIRLFVLMIGALAGQGFATVIVLAGLTNAVVLIRLIKAWRLLRNT